VRLLFRHSTTYGSCFASLNVTNYAEAYAALDTLQHPAPLLESLTICVANSLEEAPARAHATLFAGHLPRLRHCAFASFNYAWAPTTLAGLRTLSLDGYWSASAPGTPALLAVLRASPGLEELALRNLDADECSAAAAPPPGPPVLLPRLRRVVLSAAGGGRARALLAHVRAPALEELELACLGDVSPVLARLAHGAGVPALRRLRIEACALGEVALLGLLRRVPALAALELVDVSDLSSSFLQVRTHAVWVDGAGADDPAHTGTRDARARRTLGLPRARAPKHRGLQRPRVARAARARAGAAARAHAALCRARAGRVGVAGARGGGARARALAVVPAVRGRRARARVARAPALARREPVPAAERDDARLARACGLRGRRVIAFLLAHPLGLPRAPYLSHHPGRTERYPPPMHCAHPAACENVL
jgi:hypothetical protein